MSRTMTRTVSRTAMPAPAEPAAPAVDRPRSDPTEVTGPLRDRPTRHQSFLVYEHFRFLKIAVLAVVVSIVLYAVDAPYGTRYGGTWAGYTLGTVGALLILWLLWFGYRKRSYLKDQGNLVGWLSAHVYLGLALLVIATLHTGFHFGWNIHTLAYGLMCLVIASGAFGVYCYVRYPRLMTENRHGVILPQMLGRIAGLDDELRKAALTVDDRTAALIERSTESTAIGGSLWQQLSGHYPNCATAAALSGVDRIARGAAPEQEAAMRQIRVMLDEKAQLLARARRDISYKAMMDIWLYFHVPVSFALLAALLAHVISVFYLW
ncbi:MAG TPA: hypothetical protein VJ770_16310 [Stellaceae bacterium]|nr:hypothetical protein [Stellaceae bacterium]